MKKFLMAIALCLICAASCFGQLTVISPQMSDVYTIKSPFIGANGVVRYHDGVYYLLGASTNQFERKCHSIYLGDSKKTAILSIEDLASLKKNMPKDGIHVKSLMGTDTFIYKYAGEVRFQTEGVAGFTQVLAIGFKTEKIINAIKEFEETN